MLVEKVFPGQATVITTQALLAALCERRTGLSCYLRRSLQSFGNSIFLATGYPRRPLCANT
jgi:hypothetical protein